MSDQRAAQTSSTRTSRLIHASPEALYRAFLDPVGRAAWQAPGEMTAVMHDFEARVGGGYQMSLFYPDDDADARGKSGAREDRFSARFLELEPSSRIVEAITFDANDPAFAGEMISTVTFAPRPGGTEVTYQFDRIPPGIRPEDNDLGTRLTLQKLADFIE